MDQYDSGEQDERCGRNGGRDDDGEGGMETDEVGGEEDSPPRPVAATVQEYFEAPDDFLPHPDFIKDNYFVEVSTMVEYTHDLTFCPILTMVSCNNCVYIVCGVCVGGYHTHLGHSKS